MTYQDTPSTLQKMNHLENKPTLKLQLHPEHTISPQYPNTMTLIPLQGTLKKFGWSGLVDLVAADLARGDVVGAAAVAVAQAVAVAVGVELDGGRVGVPVGSAVELELLDVEDGREGNVLAAAVLGAVHGDVAAVLGPQVKLPGGGEGDESGDEKAGLHFDR